MFPETGGQRSRLLGRRPHLVAKPKVLGSALRGQVTACATGQVTARAGSLYFKG